MVLFVFITVVVLVGVWLYSKFKVPNSLQHIPSRPLIYYILDMFSNESIFAKIENIYSEQLQRTKVMLLYRLGTWNVVVTCLDTAKQIFKDTDTFRKGLPSDINPERLFSKFLGEAVLFSNGEVWRKHRKVTNLPFKKQFEVHTFCRAAAHFFKVLETCDDASSLNIHKYMQRITMNAMGKDIMGVEFDAVVNEEVPFIQAYNSVMKGISLPLPNLFPVLDTKKNRFLQFYFDQLHFIDTYFNDILQKKKLELADSKMEHAKLDLLSLLIKAKDDAEGNFTDLDIRNNIMTFLLAGHDTTAFALSSALHYLADNRHVQEKARNEVLQVIGYTPTQCDPENAKRPTLEQTKQMDYLTAVIKETMRMSPSVPRLPLRITTKEINVNGYTLPPNTNILLDIYSMHHDPNNFKDPHTFKPERFLNLKSNDVQGYYPFGGGSRLCLGINFSMLEQKVVLAMILSRYRISNSNFTIGSSFLPAPINFNLKFELLTDVVDV